jgi:hypothetical protein
MNAQIAATVTVRPPRRVEHVMVASSAERAALQQTLELAAFNVVSALRSCAVLKEELLPSTYALLLDFYRKQLVDVEMSKAVLARAITHLTGEPS